jgi:hypothetical protein
MNEHGTLVGRYWLWRGGGHKKTYPSLCHSVQRKSCEGWLGSNNYLYVGRPQPHNPIHDTPLEDISLGVKWPEHAADYSPRSTGDVKN